MMKIVADANIPFVKECFSSIGEVTVVGGREITPGVVADADALLVRSITPVGEKLLAGSKVRFVATATIGFDHVDIDFLGCKNIGFASAPGSPNMLLPDCWISDKDMLSTWRADRSALSVLAMSAAGWRRNVRLWGWPFI